ncbi:MAG: glycosyltransferase family 1 protein [Chitinophagaceae bacterium]|nr:MAG: glycosyltransferase family 1 protein [Chitinophagaceae bacterium]
MKYAHTGLYHFCYQLGKHMLNSCPADKEMHFFYNNKTPKVFGETANYRDQYSLQKHFMPAMRGFDLWHSTFQLTTYLPRRKRVKVISTIHDLNFLQEFKSDSKIKRYVKKIQKLVDRSQEVVAISHYVKKDIEKHCNLKGKTVHVIYNGNNINAELANQENDAPIVSGNYLYTIGTINRKKNFHTLLYLLLGNDLKLVISGVVHEPEYHEKIKQLAQDLGVADRVTLTLGITEEEKYNYLKHCAVFCFPSIAEGFGLPVIEAMSFGKKVLLSKYTCLPEIGGEEAFYLDETSEAYMENFGRNKIMQLVEMPPRTAEIKQWASQFSWEKAAKSYWEIYNRMLTQ